LTLKQPSYKPTDLVLKWDYERQCQRVTNPLYPIPKGYKEYLITVETEYDTKEGWGGSSTEWPVWARNRKHALSKAKRYAIMEKLSQFKCGARLYWKGNSGTRN